MMNAQSADDYVLTRYNRVIKYYRKTSRHNRKTYKLTRSTVVILGAIVTLMASLGVAQLTDAWDTALAILTAVLAAILTIAGGFSQTFHWGATWRDSILNAERLELERDRIRITKPEDRDPAKELALLNDLVITETETFFQRILGGAKREKEAWEAQDKQA